MKKYPISWSQYKQLELISSEEPEVVIRKPTLKERIQSIWEYLVICLLEPQELRVWSTRDCWATFGGVLAIP